MDGAYFAANTTPRAPLFCAPTGEASRPVLRVERRHTLVRAGVCMDPCGTMDAYKLRGAGEMQSITGDGERLIRLDEVRKITALGRSTVFEKVRNGAFPQPVALHGKLKAWRYSEIQSWISSLRPEAAQSKNPVKRKAASHG